VQNVKNYWLVSILLHPKIQAVVSVLKNLSPVPPLSSKRPLSQKPEVQNSKNEKLG
jgi:hypothetical protein